MKPSELRPRADCIARRFGFVDALDLIRQSPELQNCELARLFGISRRTLEHWRTVSGVSGIAKRGYGTKPRLSGVPGLVLWVAVQAGRRVGNDVGLRTAEKAHAMLKGGNSV